MSLRDLVVGIDFDDIDIKKLLEVDDVMNEIEGQFKEMDDWTKDASKDFEDMGSRAEDALIDVRSGAGDLGDAMTRMSDDGGDAMDDLRRDTNQAGDAMDQLGRDGRNAGDDISDAMDEAGDSATDAGNEAENSSGGWETFKKLGVGAATAIVTAIAGITTAVGLMVMDMEEQYDRLAAKTGATGEELAGLENVVRNVFTGAFGESLGQVGDDVAALNSMFKDLNDEQLQTLAEGAYTISDLWGADVKEVGGVVRNLTSNFKDLSEQQALDLITTGFQKTGDYADDLMDTFKEYAPYFSKMGMSAEEFTGTLIAGAEAGAWNLDKVGDSVKEFGIRAMDGSDASSEAFEELGFNADEMANKIAAGGDGANDAFMATIAALSQMDDKVKMGQTGVALFGTQWEDVREDVIFAMQDAEGAVGEFEGATKEAGDAAYDNFGTTMTGIFRDIKMEMAEAFKDNGGEELLQKIVTKAEELKPMISDIVGEAIDFANAVADNWPAIETTVMSLGAAVGSFVAIMGALRVIGAINTLMVAYRAGTVMATLAQWGLNTAMLANPITWVVAGIAALIGIGVLLYRNWDTVKAKMGQLWDFLGKAWDGLLSKAGEAWDGIKGFFVGGANAVIDAMNGMIKGINNIGFDVPDWVPVIGGKEYSLNIPLIPRIGGSHLDGLESVPFDGYIAELHKDEAVLTSDQSDQLRETGVLSSRGEKPVLNDMPKGDSYEEHNNISYINDYAKEWHESQNTEVNEIFNSIDKKQNDYSSNINQTENNETNNISRSNDRYETNNNYFNPVVKIDINGSNVDQDVIDQARQATREELEQFWLEMNLKHA